MNPTTLAEAEPKISVYARFFQKREFQFESECLDSHVIFWLEDGRFSWRIEGHGEGIAEKGDLLLCPAGARFHREMIEPATLHVLRLTLDGVGPDALPPVLTHIAHRERILHDLGHLPNYISPRCRLLAAERHYLADVWYLLLEENALLTNTRQRTLDDPLIAGAVDFIEQNLHKRIDLDRLAARCMLSPSGFIRRFQKVIGMTPMQFVIDCRMNRAIRLLCESTLTVAEIGRRCGYENEFYFSASFKKASGMPPSTYRELYRI